jgi:protein-tyrosine phosphatase
MIIGMDEENMSLLQLKAPSDFYASKIFKMTDFCIKFDNTYVPDPYYGGDKGFENVIDILEDACNGLLKHLKQK